MAKAKLKVYPIEEEAEKLLREIKLLIRKIGKFFFEIPKKKEERMIYVIETLAWLLLGIALIWRLL